MRSLMLLTIVSMCFANTVLADDSAVTDCPNGQPLLSKADLEHGLSKSAVFGSTPQPLVVEQITSGQFMVRFIEPTTVRWYYGWDAPF